MFQLHLVSMKTSTGGLPREHGVLRSVSGALGAAFHEGSDGSEGGHSKLGLIKGVLAWAAWWGRCKKR